MTERENEVLRQTVERLKKYLAPSQIILFGSRAKKNSNNNHADFDFAVDSKKPEISMQRELKEAIDEVRGLYKVDIVYMPSVDEEFKKIIMKTGRVVYER